MPLGLVLFQLLRLNFITENFFSNAVDPKCFSMLVNKLLLKQVWSFFFFFRVNWVWQTVWRWLQFLFMLHTSSHSDCLINDSKEFRKLNFKKNLSVISSTWFYSFDFYLEFRLYFRKPVILFRISRQSSFILLFLIFSVELGIAH